MLQLLLLTGEPVSSEAHLAQLLGQLFTWTLRGGGVGVSSYLPIEERMKKDFKINLLKN